MIIGSIKGVVSRLYGSSLLIAGCCIGAGMLGMPVLSGPFGFFPTLAMFVCGFTYMLVSGFVLTDLLVDASQRGERHVHLLSLSEAIFGKAGKAITWILFGFLFYAVLTAYTIGAAKLIQEMSEYLLPAGFSVSQHAAAFVTVLITVFIISRKVSLIDVINRWCLFGLVLIYIALVAISSTEFQIDRVFRSHWGMSLFTTLPVITFSFGYHNLLPTIASYLDYDRQKIRKAIAVGILIPFVVYVIWELIIFGIVPLSSYSDWLRFIESGEMITTVVYESVQIPVFVDLTRLFAFFALVTSYVTVGMSMADFLQDGLSSAKEKNSEGEPRKKGSKRLIYVLLALIPPYIIGNIDPSMFLSALSYSGGVIAMLLFGVLPAFLYATRPPFASMEKSESVQNKNILKIVFLISGAIFIMAIELGQRIGLKIPHP